MRRVLAIALLVSGCSTSGELYSEGDGRNGEFSVVNTLLLPFAIVGVVVGGAAAGYAAAPRPVYVYRPVVAPVTCTSVRGAGMVTTNCW